MNKKQTFLSWATSSTVHGIPKVFSSSNSVSNKILWVLCILASSTICLLLISSNISTFLSFDVTTNIKIINERPVTFPKITVCNFDPFVSQYGIQFQNDVLDQFKDIPQEYSVLLEYVAKIYASSLSLEQMLLLGNPKEQFIISCYFRAEKCNLNEIIHFYHFDYGNCYIINPGVNTQGSPTNPYQVIQEGPLNGLIIELFVQSYHAENQGAIVFLSNNSYGPTEFEGIVVPSASTSRITANRIFRHDLGEPYNICKEPTVTNNFDSDLIKLTESSNFSYTQKACFELCYQQHLYEECDCYDPRYRSVESQIKVCQSFVELACFYTTYTEFLKGDLNEECAVSCPTECTKQEFSPFVSTISYPTEYFFNHNLFPDGKNSSDYPFEPNASFAEMRNNLARVEVYYDRFSYTSIKQAPSMTLISLISSTGGLLGLFLGMSFLSFVEIFDLIMSLLTATKKSLTTIKANRIADTNDNNTVREEKRVDNIS